MEKKIEGIRWRQDGQLGHCYGISREKMCRLESKHRRLEKNLHVLGEITQVGLVKLGHSFNWAIEENGDSKITSKSFACWSRRKVNSREGTGYKGTG